MGQYYKPVSIEKKEHVESWTYKNGAKLMEHSWLTNKFVRVVEGLIAKGGAWFGNRIVWAGDYADPEPGMLDAEFREENLYNICNTEIKPNPSKKKFRYVIDNDTKQYVDTTKVPISDVYTDENGKDWPYVIHPLPLLTCDGNGRGGGDFHKESPLVGKWARHHVTVDSKIPKGYTELKFNLYEGKKPFKVTPKKETVKV